MEKKFGAREAVGIVARLAGIVGWVIIAIANLALAMLALVVLWALGVQPERVWAEALATLDATWWKVAGACGVTVLLPGYLYVRLLRWIHRKPLGTFLRRRILQME